MGEVTFEPLSIIATDDPVICAIYERENNLLERLGWLEVLQRHFKMR